MSKPYQPSLFDDGPALPEGFSYQDDVMSTDEERDLVEKISALPFKAFEFHGYLGNRRVVSFGWRYEFGAERLRPADELPAFTLPVRDRAAAFAGLAAEDLQHLLVTEYAPGAGIGWHKDKDVFGKIVGVSLLAPCSFRLRQKRGERWERLSIALRPRSAYLLSGAVRSDWEHSIPPVEELRYSLTFRSFEDERARRAGRI